jgi:2-keto-3-deoxy-galactonokinase
MNLIKSTLAHTNKTHDQPQHNPASFQIIIRCVRSFSLYVILRRFVTRATWLLHLLEQVELLE